MVDIDTIYFGPGASKCFMYLGAVQAMVDTGYIELSRIRTWGGVSAGSMMALAYLSGLTPSQVTAFFVHLDMHLLLSDCEGDCLGMIDDKKSIFMIREVLRELFGVTDISFLELRKRSGKDFRVQVTNLTRRQSVVYDADLSPNMSVATALRMSTSMPILFPPVEHEGELYVDGGLIRDILPSHNPIHTLSFRVRTDVSSCPTVAYETFLDYVFDVIGCFYSLHYHHHDGVSEQLSPNMVELLVTTPGGTCYFPDNETQRELIDSGYRQGKQWTDSNKDRMERLHSVIKDPQSFKYEDLEEIRSFLYVLPVDCLRVIIKNLSLEQFTSS